MALLVLTLASAWCSGTVTSPACGSLRTQWRDSGGTADVQGAVVGFLRPLTSYQRARVFVLSQKDPEGKMVLVPVRLAERLPGLLKACRVTRSAHSAGITVHGSGF